jgi:cation diffusion facilitator CzcD-associated flavoprotein CzcO
LRDVKTPTRNLLSKKPLSLISAQLQYARERIEENLVDLSGIKNKHITIIGTGFGGLCMAIQLLRHGHDNFTLVEKMDDIGGTWRDNSYPGCACDVPSHLYSFSFETRSSWSRTFPSRDEIYAYITELGVKYKLYDKTRFNTEITSATYDEHRHTWTLTDTADNTFETDILISGLGQLNRPKMPTIRGEKLFKGPVFHSARWEHQHDLTGKRVAVIGNGPSAAQFIPEIAKIVTQMTVFQRSPCHVVPRTDKPYSAFQKFLFKYVPGFRRFYRGLVFWTLESNFVGFNEVKSMPFIVRLLRMAGSLEDKIQEQFDTQVTKPALKKILWPDYPIGCKRVVISDDYYPALMRDNVSIETSSIDEITSRGIRTRDGVEHKFDAIIFGTGFESTDFLAPLSITGRAGHDLNKVWRDGAEAYLGISMPHFPNFFMLYGPNTNLGTNSIIYMIEGQVNHVLSALAYGGARQAGAIELRDSAMTDFLAKMNSKMSTTVWAAGCDSWYKNEAGKITNNWPDFPHRYRQATDKFDANAYTLSQPKAAE